MKYEHLRPELNKVKGFVGKNRKVVWYQDLIQGGYSLKVEYMVKDNQIVLDTFEKLKAHFPDKKVRLLQPNEYARPYGWHAVRIWVK